MSRRLAAIDLFAGAGGLSFGFLQAGFDILAAVEMDDRAVDTYRTSFVRRHSPTTKCLHADVSAPLTLSKLEEIVGDRELDALIGGPPCQDFSPARLRRQPKTQRAALVFSYIDLVGALRPRAFLFENVPGLLTADEGRHWGGLVERLSGHGYSVLPKEMDAQDYGVPQRRRRLFVVGVREDVNRSFEFPPKVDSITTVGATFDLYSDVLPEVLPGRHPPGDPNHKARNHRSETLALLANVEPGESWREARERGSRVLKCHESHNGHYDVYGRIDASQVAPTITGGCTNPSKGRFIHPRYHRGLTVREAALLQTFPPDWRFCGGIERESLQVGNAVPVKLANALAKALRDTLGAPTSVLPSGRLRNLETEVVGAHP
jgi:DNA (cytosine-5)-methyltransferase 1